MDLKLRQNYFLSLITCAYLTVILCWYSSAIAQTQSVDDDQRRKVESILSKSTTHSKALMNCAYTQRTVISDVGSMEERFDPSAGLGLEWRLLLVNGRKPTDRQLHDYEPKSRKRHPAMLNLDYIDVDSIRFLDQSQSKLLLTFDVLPGESTGVNQHVSNVLTIDEDLEEIIELKSVAQEPFRMQPWISVQEFESISTFRFDKQTKGSVLNEVTIKLIAKSGNETLQQRITKSFSDFECMSLPLDETPLESELDQSTDEVDGLVPNGFSPRP